MNNELFEIYERNFPFIIRAKETVLHILNNADNIIIEQRDEHNALIGASVINQNTILLLCVDKQHRNKGIGSRLLEASEENIKSKGYDRIVIGEGFDYITPGVPTSRHYFKTENVDLDSNIDDTAAIFFEKRGYAHLRNCDFFDMKFDLSEFNNEEHNVGDIIDGITYKWAVLDELSGICACTDDAFREFTQFYQWEKLYDSDNDSRVLIAVMNGEVVGTLIVGIEDSEKNIGSIGCTTVRTAYNGQYIAVNLATIGTRYLRDIGMKEAFLSYTYSGLDHLYGYAGYKICIYYMMAEKSIDGI